MTPSKPQPLRRRRLSGPRSLESYIRSAVLPRFIERLREIEDQLAEHQVALRRAYQELDERCGDDRDLFERQWRAIALRWRFDGLNELIRQHNEYYPIERNLPLDPRTGDYLVVSGRPYRRKPVGPEWIFERFPPSPPAE